MRARASTTRSCTTSPPSAACSPRPTSSTWSRAASRRTRSCARSPTRSSCRTCRCSRAATRCAHKVLLLGGPNTYLPFLQECWRMRIPETWERARLRLPEGRPDRGADLRPGERAVLRRVRRGPVRPARAGRGRRATAGIDGLDEFITTGRKARLGETGGPAARRRRASELDDVPRALQDPEVRADASSSAGPDGPRASSASTAARPRRRPCSSTRTGTILKKAYQLSKGNPIQDTKEILARPAGSASTDQGATLEVHGLRRDRLRRRRARGVGQVAT